MTNGDDITQQISAITLLLTDEELKKHFTEDSAEIFYKCAKRIEEVYRRDKDEKAKDSKA